MNERKVSRQRMWQIRKKESNRCVICGKKLFNATHCYKHAVIVRERQRKRNGYKKRYNWCPSYFDEKRGRLMIEDEVF